MEFFKKKKIYIGNIKLGQILPFHKAKFISYFIGEKKLWEKGYGKTAIVEILKIAKKNSSWGLWVQYAINKSLT